LGGLPTAQVFETSHDVFTEELRLVSRLDGAFQYIVGGFYEDKEQFSSQNIYLVGDLSLTPIPLPFGSTNPLLAEQFYDREVEQLSFYGELSYDFTEQLTLTTGARRFDYKRSERYFLSSPGAFGSIDGAREKVKESGTNLKVNLSHQPNEDTMLYAQWAEGFRLGNVTAPPPPSICDVNNDGILDGTNTPINPFFESDSTENFELGAKLTLLDNRLQINTAVYRVDWHDIPLRVFASALPGQPQTCFTGITANAGEARSQGLEIEATFQLAENLRINAGGAYTDIELTSVAVGIPPSLSEGDRLPSSPDYNVNLGVQYDFELGGAASYFQADYAYVSEFFNRVGEVGDKGGDYGQLNMSAGIALNNFDIELFAHNLTNEDALTSVGVLYPDTRAYRLRPRVIGLNVGYQF
jgi:outer membrane receptor protein involved in Fe transport